MSIPMRLFITAVLLFATTPLQAADLYYIAHRGEYMTLPSEPADGVRTGVVDAPEGTRPAFERVRDNKVKAVKLDIQFTPDKVVVVSHDTNLKRTTGRDLPIAKTTYEEMKDVPFLKVGKYEGERIVTLDQALSIVKGCDLFYVDFKAYTPEMMDAAFKIFEAHGIPTSKIIIATFTENALKGAMTSHPDIRRVLHISYTKRPDGSFQFNGGRKCANFDEVKVQMQELKKELGLFGFNIPSWSPSTTPEYIKELKADGCWVSLWYGHSTEVADKFWNSGADAFVTGMPSALQAYIETKTSGK
ncbi:glycerophosphodiester phosphodiesterase [Planctomicrobium sp. SH527]|uniref:glycerophosphodiester phosphodiesterase n=1 Tax=Planctomicrobium sp. SH527 TaxID=3448123 RepID=UPI003F5C4DEF